MALPRPATRADMSHGDQGGTSLCSHCFWSSCSCWSALKSLQFSAKHTVTSGCMRALVPCGAGLRSPHTYTVTPASCIHCSRVEPRPCQGNVVEKAGNVRLGHDHRHTVSRQHAYKSRPQTHHKHTVSGDQGCPCGTYSGSNGPYCLHVTFMPTGLDSMCSCSFSCKTLQKLTAWVWQQPKMLRLGG